MWKWPEEVVGWMRENTAGRTTKELTVLINRQGFDKKYGMVFTESIVKGAKSRYGFKSGTPTGNPKGYSVKYPEGNLRRMAMSMPISVTDKCRIRMRRISVVILPGPDLPKFLQPALPGSLLRQPVQFLNRTQALQLM